MHFCLVALLLLAEPKPPVCDMNTKGIAWNFGTYDLPNVRLCDGFSFVPYVAPPSPSAPPMAVVPTAPPPPPSVPAASGPTREGCERACAEKMRLCSNDCGTIFPQICKGNCRDSDVLCVSKCSARFDR